MISIHVDVDSPWIYEREYGVTFAERPSIFFECALPRALELFDRHHIHATFFIVGQDLEWESAREFCRVALRRGHAIGNHSYSHPMAWGTLRAGEQHREIERCHNAIVQVTGQRSVGFRAPGYAIDRCTVRALMDLGYAYDSSVLPGFATLAMAAHQRLRGRGDHDGKTFGRMWYAFAARHPRVIRGSDAGEFLYEFPIAVLPFLRSPIHTTFLYAWGRTYTRLVQTLFTWFPSDCTFLLHAIDFSDDPDPEIGARVIIPFRWAHADRVALIGDMLAFLVTVGGGAIATTEAQISAFRQRHLSTSPLFSALLTPDAGRSRVLSQPQGTGSRLHDRDV